MKRLRVLTRKNFRAWLAGHRPRQVVGYRAEACGCPVALFLADQGFEHVEVCAKVSVGSIRYALPGWGVRFVSAIDFGPDGSGITARKALEILDRIR